MKDLNYSVNGMLLCGLDMIPFNPFIHLHEQLAHPYTTRTAIAEKEYAQFCKDYVFYKLKGMSFGAAFCEEFGISDYVLSRLADDTAAAYIAELLCIRH